jgi:hypothetical protein
MGLGSYFTLFGRKSVYYFMTASEFHLNYLKAEPL